MGGCLHPVGSVACGCGNVTTDAAVGGRDELIQLLIDNRSRTHPISAYLMDPPELADAILASDWLARRVAAAVQATTERVLAALDYAPCDDCTHPECWVNRRVRAALAGPTDPTPEPWCCDNYRAPVTCLTAPSSVTGRCGKCRTPARCDARDAALGRCVLDAHMFGAHDYEGATDPTPDTRTQAEALKEHRQEWASYIEHWAGAVGPEPPTVERIIHALRGPVPFGVARADALDPTHDGTPKETP